MTPDKPTPITLTVADAKTIAALPSKARRAWIRKYLKPTLQARPHPAARLSFETDDDARQARNARKRARKERSK